MKPSERAGTRQPLLRRWCVPPAMLLDPGERLNGDRGLSELPGDVGLPLWRTFRDVALQAATPHACRRGRS